MKRIQNWRGQEIEVAENRRGTLAVVDIADGLLKGDAQPWPAKELSKKLTRSGHERDFDNQDLVAVRSKYGFYSDLQSLHSEDAVTWSVFGTLIYVIPEIRTAYVKELLHILNLPVCDGEFVIWLWGRVSHPQTGKSNGPEIDFAIQGKSLVVFGEAKWKAGIGSKQGLDNDQDQLSLRRRFFESRSGDLFPHQSSVVVLTVSPDGGLQETSDRSLKSGSTLYSRDTLWGDVSGLVSHPFSEELGKYVAWKKKYI